MTWCIILIVYVSKTEAHSNPLVEPQKNNPHRIPKGVKTIPVYMYIYIYLLLEHSDHASLAGQPDQVDVLFLGEPIDTRVAKKNGSKRGHKTPQDLSHPPQKAKRLRLQEYTRACGDKSLGSTVV